MVYINVVEYQNTGVSSYPFGLRLPQKISASPSGPPTFKALETPLVIGLALYLIVKNNNNHIV